LRAQQQGAAGTRDFEPDGVFLGSHFIASPSLDAMQGIPKSLAISRSIRSDLMLVPGVAYPNPLVTLPGKLQSVAACP
jgi:hypothetical protein